MLDSKVVTEAKAKLEEQIRNLARLWEQTRQRGGRWPGGDACLFAKIIQRNTLEWVMGSGEEGEDFAIPMQPDGLPESLVDAIIFMEARPTGEVRFMVTQKGQSMKIEWFVEEVNDLAGYVLWAWKCGGRYKIGRIEQKCGSQCVELCGVHGIRGEYTSRLYVPIPYGRPFRLFTSGTHYLTQHGLDGLPAMLVDGLYGRDEEVIFRVESARGCFVMTFREWLDYFGSGRNEKDIIDLGITVKEDRLQGEQVEWFGEKGE